MSWKVCCVMMASIIRMRVWAPSHCAQQLYWTSPNRSLSALILHLKVPHSQHIPREESETMSCTVQGSALHLQKGRLHSGALPRSSSSSPHQVCPEDHSLKCALRPHLHRGTNLSQLQHFCCQPPNPFGRFLEKRLMLCCSRLNALLEGTFPKHSCLWSPLPWDLWHLSAWLGLAVMVSPTWQCSSHHKTAH